MFEKILVPVDLTEKNRRAVQQARDLATSATSEIALLHVIEELEDASFEELEGFYTRLEEKAHRELAALARIVDEAGVAVRTEVVYGKRVREILRFAEEHGSDLVVLGSHAIDREHATEGWATVSYQVAILARCTVMLVKGAP